MAPERWLDVVEVVEVVEAGVVAVGQVAPIEWAAALAGQQLAREWQGWLLGTASLNSCMLAWYCSFRSCQVSASRLSYFAVSQSLRAELRCPLCRSAAGVP